MVKNNNNPTEVQMGIQILTRTIFIDGNTLRVRRNVECAAIYRSMKYPTIYFFTFTRYTGRVLHVRILKADIDIIVNKYFSISLL